MIKKLRRIEERTSQKLGVVGFGGFLFHIRLTIKRIKTKLINGTIIVNIDI